MAAIEQVIAYYNQRRGHRQEGFRTIAVGKAGGGLAYITESPNDKARRLESELESLGQAPVRIAPADACALLLRAKKVICRPNGVTITIRGKSHRYWDPNSLAVAEVQRLATLERDYIALIDPDSAHEIYLLQNPAGKFRARAEFDLPESARFLECLPLAEAADQTSAEALALARDLTAQNHRRVAREVIRDIAPYLHERNREREHALTTMLSVVTTTGTLREALPRSKVSQAVNEKRGAKSATLPVISSLGSVEDWIAAEEDEM